MNYNVVLSSISRRAQRILRAAGSATVITSPYLTSPTAETVIKCASADNAIILTTFEAETFATKGSSLPTIEKLLKLGYQLRALKGLHAKLVLTENAVLVGSQNLTNAGARKNHEATAWIENARKAADIRKRVLNWVAISKPITPDLVAAMKSRVQSLLSLAKQLEDQCILADTQIWQNEDHRERQHREENINREKHRQKQLIAEQRRRQRAAVSPLRRAVRDSPVLEEVALRMERRDSRSYGDRHGTRYFTMQAPLGTDITRWAVPDDIGTALTKRQRYLLIAPDTGRLGWLALQKTCLTGFGSSVTNKEELVVDGIRFAVSIYTNLHPHTLGNWNIEFRLKAAPISSELVIRGLFTLTGFQTRKLTVGKSGIKRAALVRRLNDKNDLLSVKLSEIALRPFRYEKNSTTGVSTEDFCTGLPPGLTLRLRRYGSQLFFSLE